MSRKTYPAEFRQRIIELARSGYSAEQLAKEYEPSANTIRKWVQRADAAARSQPSAELTGDDKDRLIRELRRQLAQEREEKEILRKAAAWFARESVLTSKPGSGS